jgi:hypothetical protein
MLTLPPRTQDYPSCVHLFLIIFNKTRSVVNNSMTKDKIKFFKKKNQVNPG